MSLEHDPGRSTKPRPGRKWPLLMRVSEVAFELGLSTRRIYQMIAAGELKIVRIGKAMRVRSTTVRRLAGDQDADAE